MKKAVHKVKRGHHHLVSLPIITILVMMTLTGWLSLQFLRQNNLKMTEKRQAVIEADARGNKEEIEKALGALQYYVSRHMNTTTRVELQSSYFRESERRQKDAAERLGNVNLYREAEERCVSQGLKGSILADCINQQLTGESGSLVELPNPALYRYSFAAPLLSFDTAGVTLVFFSIFTYSGLYRLVRYLVSSSQISKNNRK